MSKLKRSDLHSLEKYAEMRNSFRKEVMAHKKNRRVIIGEHLVLLFEDKLLMQYQVQEILRTEKIFEADSIEEELSAYNPLIPDGSNWKATMMVQYDDVEVRKKMLGILIGIEDVTYMQVAGFDEVYPIADEDLSRDDEHKTSAVHFLRYELSPEMIAAVKQGAAITTGCKHTAYQHSLELSSNIRDSLAKDFD